MIGPIKTVAVYVEDQARAEAFYTGPLGFVVRRRVAMGPEASWIEVGPPGGESCVVLYPRSMTPDWALKKPSVVFHCPDVEATCLELAKEGVRITMPPTSLPWGTFAVIADIDGNELGLTSQRIAPEAA
jgi:predicted enzyme related to lactoylglutathione lyase